MNTGKKITELREATAVQGESSYPVSMGDGTGVKQVKHSTLVEQLKTDMGMTYDETMELLRAADGEGNKKVPDVRAVSDWIASKIANNLLTTAPGFFLDARIGPVIDQRFTGIEQSLTQINSDLSEAKFQKAWLQNGSRSFSYKTMALIFICRRKAESGGFYMADNDSDIVELHHASSAITVTCTNKEITVSNNNQTVQTVLVISY